MKTMTVAKPSLSVKATRPLVATVRRACLRSKQAYMTAEQTPDPHDVLISDAGTDAQVVVSKDTDDGVTCVAFRGTSTLRDWKMNSRVWLVPSSLEAGAMVHSGFWLQWESLKKEVYAAIAENASQRVVITGHSLGSGLAHISCTDIADAFPDVDVQVITFAGPRPGNSAFGSQCRARCPNMLRVIYDNDVVPNVPSMAFGYNHGDCECLHLQPDGSYSFSNGDVNWWSETLYRLVRMFTFSIGVDEHNIDYYVEALDAIGDEF